MANFRKHAKAEIVRYARGSLNAKQAVAYAFTLNNGHLYSGEYMFVGEQISADRFDGYCPIGSTEPVRLSKGESISTMELWREARAFGTN